ncbi:TetR/AcrR family transcriptional regulator [Enterococcus sp. CWB-B31]|uniref:TetR/AcrR family transcriptional regulator n=1 Tax=Enterococcus sp. CWB-B31 TaxID=2885159 RepID=UPI001E5A5540|nr:TetR/AcrR family transcriptional regulator [Enterococcus sp. CWB-B31]MCB5953470.1 TetR/AcrR family transcriptional regulator [Enterococcus sp. CWB-B31]
MNGFERRRKEKEQNILQAALDLFMKNGIKNTSVQAIAASAKVSPVTIFNYFDAKENLLIESCTLYFNKTYNDFFQIIHSDKSFEEKMQYLIFTKSQLSKDIHPEFYEFIMLKFSESDNPYMKNFLTKGITMYQTLFDQGKEEGVVNKDISDQALLIYMQLLSTSMQNEDIYKTILPFTDEITAIFLYGIYGKRDETTN